MNLRKTDFPKESYPISPVFTSKSLNENSKPESTLGNTDLSTMEQHQRPLHPVPLSWIHSESVS